MTYIEDCSIMKVFIDSTMTDSIFSNYQREEYKAIEFNDCFGKVFSGDSLTKTSTSIKHFETDSFISSPIKLKESKILKTKRQKQLQKYKKQIKKAEKFNIAIANGSMSNENTIKMLNREEKLINKMIEYVKKFIKDSSSIQ